MTSFFRERRVKSVRKRHLCETCGKRLELGERAIRWVGMTDGEFGSAIFHPECRAAEIDHNRAYGGYSDEWYRLADEGTAEIKAWLFSKHPVVAARFYPTDPQAPAHD